jgi:hypothetical protein
MKQLIVLLLTFTLATISVNAQTESFDRFVRKMKKHASNEDRVDITLPGFLVRLGLKFVDNDDIEKFRPFTKKISEIRVVSLENCLSIPTEDYTAFIKDVRAEGFEDLLTVRSTGERVHVMIKERKDLIRNIVILVDGRSDHEFVLINLEGKFTMEDLAQMIEELEKDKNKK